MEERGRTQERTLDFDTQSHNSNNNYNDDLSPTTSITERSNTRINSSGHTNIQIVEDGVRNITLSPTANTRRSRKTVVSPTSGSNNNNNNNNNNFESIYRRSTSRSRSRGRSTDRTTLDIDNDESLKLTILRKNPVQRLNLVQTAHRKKKSLRERLPTSEEEEDDDDDDDDEDYEDYDYTKDKSRYDNSDDDDEDSNAYSDEEQVSDIDNDQEIDQELNFDMGSLVLPNFEYDLFSVVENSKEWVEKFKKQHGDEIKKQIKCDQLIEGCYRASLCIGGESAYSDTNSKVTGTAESEEKVEHEEEEHQEEGKSYILYHDLSHECHYALSYIFGTILKKGDSLFILNVENSTGTDTGTGTRSSSLSKKTPQDLQNNVENIYHRVKYLFDSLRVLTEGDIQVSIISTVHPYPKHLLNTMIYALSPVLLIVPLSIMITTLVNYISTVPTLVIRRKLRKSVKR